MWLLIPAVFRGKLHFHWGGKQRMYDINSGVLIPVNQRPQWRKVRRLEFGLNVTWYIVMIVNCRFWLLFNERSVQSDGVKDLHCTANAMICDCNKLTKTGESINMFVDAWISTCLGKWTEKIAAAWNSWIWRVTVSKLVIVICSRTAFRWYQDGASLLRRTIDNQQNC